MRFRSLVVSWCVCAIHGSVQIASGHRSLDATYHPPGDIETLPVRSPRDVSPNLPSFVPSLPASRPRSPTRYSVAAISKPAGVAERIKRRIPMMLVKRATADPEKIVQFPVKRESYRKRRGKCKCRGKRHGRRRMGSSLFRDEASEELGGLSTVKNLFTPTNVPALSTTLETSTTPQRIAFTTIEADADGTYRRNSSRKRCKKIKCVTENCRSRSSKGKVNVIDVLDQGFFRDNLGNGKISRTKTTSGSVESSIVD